MPYSRQELLNDYLQSIFASLSSLKESIDRAIGTAAYLTRDFFLFIQSDGSPSEPHLQKWEDQFQASLRILALLSSELSSSIHKFERRLRARIVAQGEALFVSNEFKYGIYWIAHLPHKLDLSVISHAIIFPLRSWARNYSHSFGPLAMVRLSLSWRIHGLPPRQLTNDSDSGHSPQDSGIYPAPQYPSAKLGFLVHARANHCALAFRV